MMGKKKEIEPTEIMKRSERIHKLVCKLKEEIGDSEIPIAQFDDAIGELVSYLYNVNPYSRSSLIGVLFSHCIDLGMGK